MFLHLVGPQGYEVEDEWDKYAFSGGLLEGTGITQGLAIAPFTLGFWENHFQRHVQPPKPWGDNKPRFNCVPVHTD